MPASSDPPADQRDQPAPAVGSGVEGECAPVVISATLPAGVALHARPAADLVRAAGRLRASVTIAANGRRANARSILEVLALGATGGAELTIAASGEGAAEAASVLAETIASLGG